MILPLGALAAPLLPPPWSVLALVGVGLVWLRTRPPRREGVLVAVALGLSGGALIAGWVYRSLPRLRSTEAWISISQPRYERLLGDLDRQASKVATELAAPSTDPAARLEAFRRLRESVRDVGRGTLLLLDPDGVAIAWAGEGLLHDLEPDRLPNSGFDYVASYTAVTLVAVEPLDDRRRPWRVLAGRSFATGELPFPPPMGEEREGFRWSLETPTPEPRDGAFARLKPAAGPTMIIERSRGEGAPGAAGRLAERFAWAVLGLALIALAVMRGTGLPRPLQAGFPPWHPVGEVALLVLAGTVAWGLAAAVPLPLLAVLGPAVSCTLLVQGGLTVAAPPWMAAVVGGLGVFLLGGAAWVYQSTWGPVDLASSLSGGSGEVALRLVVWALSFAVLSAVSIKPRGERAPGHGWVWTALGLFLLAGALHDISPVAILPLAIGGSAVAVWGGQAERRRSGASIATVALLTALASAGLWEAAHRHTLKAHLASRVLPRLEPAPKEINAVAAEVRGFFKRFDADELGQDGTDGLARQDLALAVWRRSPLARSDALSAVVVQPFDGAPSSFSFGLPLEEGLEVNWAAEESGGPGSLVRREGAITGTAELRRAGQRWAVARYWFLPQPGFGLVPAGLEELEVDLLRGGPVAIAGDRVLLGPTLYARYAPSGRPLLAPWAAAPPLAAELGEGRAAVVDTPAGRAWGWAQPVGRHMGGGTDVLYLPRLSPLGGLERVATHALSVIVLLACGLLLVLLLGLLRPGFRESLRRSVRSYSNRLMVVLTGLLIIPMLLLNLVLFRSMGQRLEQEQRAAGEAALTSASRIVGDYVLSLDPGFAIDTQLNDELLIWLSQVVHHEVNLYWGSYVYASSKPELFTAGLLPRRIPGEIYSRLALLGYHLASRTNRAGRDTTYLELYTPLSVAGVPAGQQRLFLSIPLLAQQEEVTTELLDRARQALLVTTALFLLLLSVGARLARSFTTPVMEIVRGIPRIAAGEMSLGLHPTQPELSSLVNAIDEMARRIAEGRSKLVQEKKVVERMVENITSGVVSLDRDRRVLMRNKVAAELLGVEVGQGLDEIARSEALRPVASFLTSRRDHVRQTTARLNSGGENEREWTLVWVPVPGSGDPAALLVVEDVTEVLRGQRLQAWAEMARIIAHEIKNPLTPIRLNAEHLREVYATDQERFDEVFDRCTRNILRQVEDLYEISAEFSTYSHIPRIDPKAGDLVAAVAEVTEGYRAAPPEGVEIGFSADPARIPTRFDQKLLGRAVRNLVENAIRASGPRGRISIRVEQHNGTARISVADRGPGVAPELLGRIFDPYFSSHAGGTGLGLPIARRIAEEHGGTITAQNRAGGGLEVAISMPL